LLVYNVEHVDFDLDPLVSSSNRGANTLVKGGGISRKKETMNLPTEETMHLPIRETTYHLIGQMIYLILPHSNVQTN
jgi:hypothetical protein